jgi:hypothetical protein
MLRTPDDLIEALRARKDEIGLSNAVLEELAGMAAGHVDKVLGHRAPAAHRFIS